jgi:hypothetical protein
MSIRHKQQRGVAMPMAANLPRCRDQAIYLIRCEVLSAADICVALPSWWKCGIATGVGGDSPIIGTRRFTLSDDV